MMLTTKQILELGFVTEDPAVDLELQFKALLKVCKVGSESNFVFNTMLEEEYTRLWF